ncbi:hypothetical protein [Nocardia wallacei]|uniref:hypothetical protein n=1 Tax=Nocardia wallacei TaxID=480035 RepID=UPI002455C474|nr:hypothetical protein [Nocardia wallacei]
MTDTTDTSTKPLVFLDCETTHLHPDLRHAWEIALIRRPALPGLDIDRLTILIDDVDLSHASRESLDIGRFFERHPRYTHGNYDDPWAGSPLLRGVALVDTGPGTTALMDEREAAATVEEWTRGAVIIGVVPDFDTYTLGPMLRRNRLMPGWHYQAIDVETEAAGWLKGRLAAGDLPVAEGAGPDEPQRSVDEILTALRPPRHSDVVSVLCGVQPPGPEERHTAMGDAAWAERWWDALDLTRAS